MLVKYCIAARGILTIRVPLYLFVWLILTFV